MRPLRLRRRFARPIRQGRAAKLRSTARHGAALGQVRVSTARQGGASALAPNWGGAAWVAAGSARLVRIRAQLLAGPAAPPRYSVFFFRSCRARGRMSLLNSAMASALPSNAFRAIRFRSSMSWSTRPFAS